ncbi:hypothetical protein PENSPDRAFT_638963 [Peniophora sp. CONT]|nr:hypothetical protein PENSPDRAFT_638963 [Peniophora sp. CONT]
MSHALLLRLFLSPSFFSVHVALRYLNTYSDNIGITYYLTRRLSEYSVDELRDVWGFICHLLVSRPSQSRALECFVTDISRKSTHIALITLWFMQAAFKDYSANPQSPQALICQRTLLMCHELIFGDLPPPDTIPYPSLATGPRYRPLFARKKVKPHAIPALIGMGLTMAGSVAHPTLANIMVPVAIEQGRADLLGLELRSLQRNDEDVAHSAATSSMSLNKDAGEGSDSDDDAATPAQPTRDSSSSPESSGRKRSPRRKLLHGAASTSPSLPMHLKKPRKPRFSDDPLGQLDQDEIPKAATYSSPALSSARQARTSSSLNEQEALLAKYAPQAQRELLRKHFCRSEVQFILTLENISNRLLVVPKPARVSALRAELTALNHKLPAEVCMPLWCSSADGVGNTNDSSGAHHRIVRIPPGECVVLNSAERAPYLLLVEILNGDLDFDPAKRNNRGLLQKLVAADNDHSGSSKDITPFAPTPAPTMSRAHSFALPGRLASSDPRDVALGSQSQDGPVTPIIPPSPTMPSSPLQDGPEEEEIDLVEQLYGAEGSLKAPIDLSDNLVLPPAPKNRDLDLAAWSRAGSPATPMLESGPSSFGHTQTLSIPGANAPSTQTSPRKAGELSLQDYSDRMRTAAVMLAQLNANLVPDAPPAHERSNSNGGVLGWLPGSNWFSVLPPSESTESTSVPASPLPGASTSDISGPRLKLQPAEAAAIRERIMDEMLALEEERMERMRERQDEPDFGRGALAGGAGGVATTTAEDEGVIRRALTRTDPSALVFSESWAAKRARVRQSSPYGHLASWDCASVIVKTGGDLRQEQLACALVLEFARIWKDEGCACYARPFRILITGGTSGLIETITDAVSIHSIKKAEYARRLTVGTGNLGHVSLFDHFKNTYGDPSSAKFARAQRNFAKSLAGYSVITYLLQIKDRHNGNILLDREGHLVHIDFGFMLANSPGNMGFEAAPFKLPLEHVDVLGGLGGAPFAEFRRLFREGFEAARKHCDRIVTVVELMQHDSTLPCFAAFGEQTAQLLRDRFQQKLTQAMVEEHVDRLVDTSLGSHWTRLYDSYQYYSQSIL